MMYMKKSIYSWIALIIGVWLVITVLVTLGARAGLYGSFESPLFIFWIPLMFFPYAEIVWSAIGIILGGIGLSRKEPKKNLAIIGIILIIGVIAWERFDFYQFQQTHPNTFPTEEQRVQPGFQP